LLCLGLSSVRIEWRGFRLGNFGWGCGRTFWWGDARNWGRFYFQ